MDNELTRNPNEQNAPEEEPRLVAYGRWEHVTREIERGGCGSLKDIQLEASNDPQY